MVLLRHSVIRWVAASGLQNKTDLDTNAVDTADEPKCYRKYGLPSGKKHVISTNFNLKLFYLLIRPSVNNKKKNSQFIENPLNWAICQLWAKTITSWKWSPVEGMGETKDNLQRGERVERRRQKGPFKFHFQRVWQTQAEGSSCQTGKKTKNKHVEARSCSADGDRTRLKSTKWSNKRDNRKDFSKNNFSKYSLFFS